LLSDIVSSLCWIKQTKLQRRIAVHLGVLRGGASGKYLSADETFEQAVTTDEEYLADLVVTSAH